MNGAWVIPGGWLAHTAAGGGVLLLIVWVLLHLARQPARRQRLGEWGTAAALLVAGLCWAPAWLHLPLPSFLQSSSISLSPPQSREPTSTGRPAGASSEFADDTMSDGGFIGSEGAMGAGTSLAMITPEPEDLPKPQPSGGMAEPAEKVIDPAAALTEAPTLSTPFLATWLGGMYLLIGGGLLVRWLIGHFGIWRLLRQSTEPPAPVARLFDQFVAARWASGKGPFREMPRLLVSSRLRVPVSCGLLRPTVILPAGLCEESARPALRWVFAHELTHLERRDAWACLLFSVAQAVYFYLPWFWWLRRQVRLCQEYVADAAAVEASRAEEYAQFLLSLTASPTAPAAAIGVLGNTSDLFRRVTMLLQNPMRVEGRCPWRWSLAMAGGLLAVAVLVSGIGLRAETANKADQAAQAGGDEPAKDPAKKDEPAKKDKPAKKAPDPAIGDDDDLKKALDELPAEVRDHLKKVFEGMDRELPDERLPGAGEMKKEMQKTIIRMLKQGGGPGGFGGFGGFGGGGFGGGQAGFGGGGFGGRFGGGVFGRADTVVHGRLGVFLDKPSDTLVEQLDLPKGQGLVINRVQADSAAAKAGMKASDILLELNGKPVPNDVHKFITMLNDVKANTPVDAVVLRKGKRETIKGLSLPEAKAAKAQEGFPEGGIGFGGFQPGGAGGFARFPGQQGGIGFAGFGGGPGQVMTTMIRTDDRFTTRYQEGSLIITLTGTVADGKAKLGAIHVNDGNDSKKYESVDKVPEQYRDKVKHLVEMSEKGSVRVEIKTNPDKKPDDGEKKP